MRTRAASNTNPSGRIISLIIVTSGSYAVGDDSKPALWLDMSGDVGKFALRLPEFEQARFANDLRTGGFLMGRHQMRARAALDFGHALQ